MRRYLSALLVLCFAVTVFAQPPQQQQTQQPPAKRDLTLDNMMMGDMAGMMRAPQGMQWSPDSLKIAYIVPGPNGQGQSLYYFDPATGKSAVLVAADKLAALKPPTSTKIQDDRQKDNRARYGVAAYHWSPDSKSLLFDRMGHLWLYNLATQTGTRLTTSEQENKDPKFSPDGKYVTFVRNHNLFIRPTAGAAEQQLTKDTDKNLLNGEVDWLYEEELDVRSNYFWSPDSKQLVFLQSNETPVPTYPIVDWIPNHPTTDMIKYPKAGDPNPTVKLGVLDLNGKVKWVTPTTETDMYIPRFGWLKPGIIWAMVLNRHQNQQDLYLIDAAGGKSRKVLSEKDDYYIELTNSLYFFKSADQFLWPSWRDGHTHIYHYSLDKANPLAADAKLVNQVTKGDWEVGQVEGVDERAGVVYFTANKEDARQEQMYSIKLDGSDMALLTKQPGSHRDEMSDNTKYYVDNFSTLTTPSRMSICATGGACNEVFQAPNPADMFNELATPQFVDFKAEDGTVLHGVILLPKGGPAMKDGKFPVILNPYGGPHGQSVRDGFGVMGMFDQFLVKQGIAMLKVDNRGMSNRGKKFAVITYKHLGDIEFKDQIASLDQALEKFPQLDGSRVGFWGWSYGGSMTLNMLTHSNRFKAGVAVAPVSDWRLYDSAYTERYMSLPQDNEEGYKKASFVNAAPNLSGRLLICHGTSDDNVHMQNTVQFVNALVNFGKPYDLQIFPQKTHGIGGKAARSELYQRIVWQFEQYLVK